MNERTIPLAALVVLSVAAPLILYGIYARLGDIRRLLEQMTRRELIESRPAERERVSVAPRATPVPPPARAPAPAPQRHSASIAPRGFISQATEPLEERE